MKVTFILKNLSDSFYNGFGKSIQGLLNMSDTEKYIYLNKVRHDLNITLKIGTGQFRDVVLLNQIVRSNPTVTFNLEPRRGYKLATFEFTP